MMRIVKKYYRGVLFSILTVMLLLKLNSILGFGDNVHTAKVFDEFYKLPSDTVDVVWIGCSSVQEEVNPAVVYREKGISIYDLSTGNLPFMATKNLIIEAEKTQSPLLYLVDIRWLAVETNTDWYIHRVTDNMKFSKNRFDSINYMVNGIKKYYPEQEMDIKSLYFPFLSNHNRWEALTQEDFGKDDDVFFGYFIPDGVTEFERDKVIKRFEQPEIEISKMQQEFLNDFLDFCDEKKLNVVFTNTPNCASEEYFGQYNYIKGVIENRGYKYWDFNKEIDNIGIDYKNDFRDQYHLTRLGGEKFSKYVANELTLKYGIKNHKGEKQYEQYEQLLDRYEKKAQVFELKSTVKIDEYLKLLKNMSKKDYTILVSVKDIQGYCLDPHIIEKLKQLGFLNAETLLEKEYHSFIGAIGIEEQPIELYGGDEAIQYDANVDSRKISIESKTLNTGNESKIMIGNTNYSKNVRGLNFVVVDKTSGEVVDSVAFDTHVPEMSCYR